MFFLHPLFQGCLQRSQDHTSQYDVEDGGCEQEPAPSLQAVHQVEALVHVPGEVDDSQFLQSYQFLVDRIAGVADYKLCEFRELRQGRQESDYENLKGRPRVQHLGNLEHQLLMVDFHRHDPQRHQEDQIDKRHDDAHDKVDDDQEVVPEEVRSLSLAQELHA